jgi:hypothetical protein
MQNNKFGLLEYTKLILGIVIIVILPVILLTIDLS